MEHIDTKNHHTPSTPPKAKAKARSGQSAQKTARSNRDVGIAALQRTLQGVGRHLSETRASVKPPTNAKDYDKVARSLGANTPKVADVINAQIVLVDGYDGRLYKADPHPPTIAMLRNTLANAVAWRDGLSGAWNRIMDKADKSKVKGKSS